MRAAKALHYNSTLAALTGLELRSGSIGNPVLRLIQQYSKKSRNDYSADFNAEPLYIGLLTITGSPIARQYSPDRTEEALKNLCMA